MAALNILTVYFTFFLFTPINASKSYFSLEFLSGTWTPIDNKGYIYALDGGQIKIYCEHFYPIRWRVAGNIIPEYKMEPLLLGESLNQYRIQLNMKNVLKPASVKFSCVSLNSSEAFSKQAYVFTSRQNGIEIPTLFSNRSSVINSKIIPCFTTDPNIETKLYLKKGNISSLVNTTMIYYRPIVGFLSYYVFEGTYECVQGSYSVKIEAFTNGGKDAVFNPDRSRILSEKGTPINIKCSSKTIPVKLIHTFQEGCGIKSSENNEGKNFSKAITVYITSNASNLCENVMGRVTCNHGISEVKLFEWNYEFISFSISKEKLNNSIVNFSCNVSTRLSLYRCENGLECLMQMDCGIYSSGCATGFPALGFPFKTTTRGSLSNLLWSDLGAGGLALCSSDNGFEHHVEYFTSLDKKTYIDWRHASKRELLRLDPLCDWIYLVDTNTQFTCTVLKYFFPLGVNFELELTNGQRIFLDQKQKGTFNKFEISVLAEEDGSDRIFNEYIMVTRLDINLPADAIGIRCSAIWWNSSQSVSDVDRFKPLRYSTKLKIVYTVASVIGCIAFSVFVIIVIVYRRRYNSAKARLRNLTDLEVTEFLDGRPDLLRNGDSVIQSTESIDFLPFNSQFEISVEDIEFDSTENSFLGCGQFSYVVRGRLLSKDKSVAVKISKPTADVALFKSLLSEVKVMLYLGKHDNLVELVGVCTENIKIRSIYIATEICELGCLEKFVRKSKFKFCDLINANQQIDSTLLPGEDEELTTLDLISFAAQIAKGMVVHADLAARNVLLTRNKIAKISDFGLSRQLYRSSCYVKKTKDCPLPWKWMAPESLASLSFSTYSDIWSYGVTLYEIFTLGEIPFPNESWNPEFLVRLKGGMRMARPTYSTPEIYFKITSCWELEPEHRPAFSTLRMFFEQILEEFRDDFQDYDNLGDPNAFALDAGVGYASMNQIITNAELNSELGYETIPLENICTTSSYLSQDKM